MITRFDSSYYGTVDMERVIFGVGRGYHTR